MSKFVYKINMAFYTVEAVLRVVILLLVWSALFAANGNMPVMGRSLSDLLTFTIISRLTMMLISLKFAESIYTSVQSGDIALDFIRPQSPRLMFIAKSLGNSAVNLLAIGVPTLIIAMFFVPGMQAPESVQGFSVFLLSVAGGMMISILFELISGMLAFWQIPVSLLQWYFNVFFVLLSGGVVPLWFFPPWLHFIAKLLPFQAAYFIPVEIYMGDLTAVQILNALLVQAFWIIVLLLIQQLMWKRAVKRLVVLGG